MIFLARNELLTQNQQNTYMTQGAAAGDTVLTVKAVDSDTWADNDYVIVGEIGNKTAEIMQVNGAITDGTSITLDRSGSSGGLRFAHSINEPIYRIDFNQMEVSRATTPDGSKSVLATIDITPDDFHTRYDDMFHTTGYGFVRFKNTTTSGFSSYSDAIPYAGQSLQSLTKLVSTVRTLIDEKTDDFIKDDEIIDALNEKQKEIAHERLWTFYETELSFSAIAYQFAYDTPLTIKELHTARFATWPLVIINQGRWDMLHWNVNSSVVNPTNIQVWNGQLRLNPTPSTSAVTTNLDGGISATDTTINVDTAPFVKGDYYRFIIDDEVIYATNNTTTSYTGCLRGMEGTTPAVHLDNAVATERNFVITAQVEPVDLVNQSDETAIPEPRVLCFGAAADLAFKLSKETLSDRLQVRYEKALETLRNNYSMIISGQFTHVKDPREVPSDSQQFPDPNLYPGPADVPNA